MTEQLIEPVFKLSLDLEEGRTVKLEQVREGLTVRASFNQLCDHMSEVDRATTSLQYLIQLVLVKNVIKFRSFRTHLVPIKLYRRESELILFHVVIDLLIEILAHIGLKDHREVVTVPFTAAACVQSQNHRV